MTKSPPERIVEIDEALRDVEARQAKLTAERDELEAERQFIIVSLVQDATEALAGVQSGDVDPERVSQMEALKDAVVEAHNKMMDGPSGGNIEVTMISERSPERVVVIDGPPRGASADAWKR